jgi:hypothetical protein
MAFGGSSSRYDPADFLVPPELGKGHSERVQFHVQSLHARMVSIVARSGVFPWSRDADVLRWCVQIGLERISELEPSLINSVMRRANIMVELGRDQIYRQKFLEVFNTLRESINSSLALGDQGEARETVGRFRKEILAMPDEPERELRWKLRYIEKLETEYRQFLGETQ